MARPTALSIDQFLGKFKTGARSYLFYMSPQFPNGVTSGLEEDGVYMVKSTSLPSSNFDDITASWQGFDFKTPGKRTYDTWNVTFNVDVTANIRKAFLSWQKIILDPEKNVHSLPTTYMRDQTVTLLGIGLNDILQYRLVGAYPSAVAEVSLDYSDSNFASFDVTFTYQYFTTTPA
jgi:hypothetical protein